MNSSRIPKLVQNICARLLDKLAKRLCPDKLFWNDQHPVYKEMLARLEKGETNHATLCATFLCGHLHKTGAELMNIKVDGFSFNGDIVGNFVVSVRKVRGITHEGVNFLKDGEHMDGECPTEAEVA